LQEDEKVNKSNSSCCVPKCCKPGYVVAGGRKVTFHSFPQNGKRKEKWLQLIKRDEGPQFQVTMHTKICSRHFREEDFKVVPSGNVIEKRIVPSIESFYRILLSVL
jgi:hypothetical protein